MKGFNRESLEDIIKKQKPPTHVIGVFCFVLRGTSISIVDRKQRRLPDIGLLTVFNENFLSGLTSLQWTILLAKAKALENFVVDSVQQHLV